MNPLLNLSYEPALESIGDDYFDRVAAAEFPQHILRFRNDDVLQQIALDPKQVTDTDFIEAFGQFQAREPLLALRYHGYQFGEYNPWLGDGRGFLYGQVRGLDGELYDFGTKGSGTTPYSRSADGRLTLKGGVREVLASEALHYLGVKTSRCLSLIETGDSLWRGDEPSPTRASVMVRFSRSHIRFGTFERLYAIKRPDLIKTLLDHVIEIYYPHLHNQPDAYLLFYTELVRRTAELAAQWMSVGFCHAVLNTDNMSITGESFDYGPFAFIETLDLNFTAAYFDHFGRYRYSNQPSMCKWNLEMLQRPLAAVLSEAEMMASLETFDQAYHSAYRQRMLQKLGFDGERCDDRRSVVDHRNFPDDKPNPADQLLTLTLDFLQKTQMGYHDFFAELREQFNHQWAIDAGHILSESKLLAAHLKQLEPWQKLYGQLLEHEEDLESVRQRLGMNPRIVITRPIIEAIWEPITTEDNWQPFYELLNKLQNI
ncbi:MAG: YdiU family protein [Thermosynechococcaceae cyanobacterium]